MPRKSKPVQFPLTLHPRGQWVKKIRGRVHYFGRDREAALAKYLDQRDDLQAGRTPRVQGEGLTLKDLSNAFLTSKRTMMDGGELSPLTFKSYHETCATVCEVLGKTRLVADLTPPDFERLRAKLAERRGPVALGNEIQRVRTIFKYGFESRLLPVPMLFGPMFAKPSRKRMRQARHEAGSRMIEADEVRRIIDACQVQLRAMAMLGLNCGFGQSDVSALPRSALDLDGGWINFPRPKTGIARRCPLWGETVAALREALAARPEAKDPADADIVFITKYGHRWTRVRPKGTPVDAVAAEFTKVLRALDLKGSGSFYNLRHVFRTVADESKDQPAVNSIMGHADESMADRYRERISDDRLRAVVGVVRDWLFSKPAGPALLKIADGA